MSGRGKQYHACTSTEVASLHRSNGGKTGQKTDSINVHIKCANPQRNCPKPPSGPGKSSIQVNTVTITHTNHRGKSK